MIRIMAVITMMDQKIRIRIILTKTAGNPRRKMMTMTVVTILA